MAHTITYIHIYFVYVLQNNYCIILSRLQGARASLWISKAWAIQSRGVQAKPGWNITKGKDDEESEQSCSIGGGMTDDVDEIEEVGGAASNRDGEEGIHVSLLEALNVHQNHATTGNDVVGHQDPGVIRPPTHDMRFLRAIFWFSLVCFPNSYLDVWKNRYFIHLALALRWIGPQDLLLKTDPL